MTSNPLRSARLNGYQAADREILPEHTRAGLLAVVRSLLNMNYFAASFPALSEDWGVEYISGTSVEDFFDQAEALIEGFERPLYPTNVVSDDVVLDLIEFCARHAAKPSRGTRRGEMRFTPQSRREGQEELEGRVNETLRAGRSAYLLSSHGLVERVLSPEVHTTLQALGQSSGDVTLDTYIARGREGVLSRRAPDRDTGLYNLWAALDYLKTLAVPGRRNKVRSIERLLENVANSAFRAVINDDLDALRQVGNDFRIRHHETDAISLSDAEKDYAAMRAANLLLFLLKASEHFDPEDV